ncbi:MAG: ATP-binding protein [Candidatus Omnitrophica bacterium]|nr:ATP-binding protein [Candidatus Omnitrophota bacterium]
MTFKFKIPVLIDHKQIDEILKQEDDLQSLFQKKEVECVLFDFSDAAVLSASNVLLIKKMLYVLRGSGIKSIAEYGEDRGRKQWFLETMRLARSSKKSSDAEAYLDTFRVPVESCISADDSLKAVNKLVPIIRSKYHPSEDILKAINWILWEIVDNAGNHGYRTMEFNQNYPQPVFFCAYAYNDFIDIAVLDMGQGIQQSFLTSGKEKYKSVTNEEALRLCIQDKESGHPKGSPGFGLYGCSEIVRQSGGRLDIISGPNRLLLNGRALTVDSCYNLSGTLVSIRIPAQFALDLKGIFGENSVIATEDIDSLFGDFNG